MCINFIHPLPWRLRQSASMALLEDHPPWCPQSTGPTEHMEENNSARSRPGLQETHNLNKNGVATIMINNFIPHSKLFSETEGFLIDGASFRGIKFSDPPVLKSHIQTFLLFPFP